MDDANLIATGDLTLANVPPGDANLKVLEEFCLTIDGYQGERFSIDDLVELARRVERAGLETASLDDLRISAFIRQREYRWSTDQGQQNLALAEKIRALVREIRRRIEKRAQNGS